MSKKVLPLGYKIIAKMAESTKFYELKRQANPRKSFEGMGGDPRYNLRAWRELSAKKKRKNPICEVEGCTQPTHTVDHLDPINLGGKLLCKMSRLMSLCKYHNFSKTQSQRGQYNK